MHVQTDFTTVDACLEDVEVLALPVTDDAGRMLGVVARAHVDALVEQAADGQRKSLGIVGGEELRSMPIGGRSCGGFRGDASTSR